LLLLCTRIIAPDSFSGWSFGDTQTLLSLKQWDKGGWKENKFLFAPQGYSSFAPLLDTPPLAQHAHGVSPHTSPSVGPRRLYTHYPSGYLFPYAFFHSFGGVQSAHGLQLVSIIISLLGAALFYAALKKVLPESAAFAAAAFYVLSPAFADYSYSLANQPLDDMLRWLFVFLIIANKDDSPRLYAAAWGAQLALSLCSFDSVLFVFCFLLGWDALRREFSLKKYALFALAPLLAHGLQFAQNSWYLGLHSAWRDAADTFFSRSRHDTALLAKIADAFNPYLSAYAPVSLAVFAAAAAAYLYFARRETRSLAVLLLLCGLPMPLLLPGANFSYQVRQLLPFISVCAGLMIVEAVSGLLRLAREKRYYPGGAAAVSCGVAAVWLLAQNAAALFAPPAAAYPVMPSDITLAKAIKDMPAAHEKTVFNIDGFATYQEYDYVPGYPQICPEVEYYSGGTLVLSFTKPQDLARDLAFIRRNAGAEFSPILVARDISKLDAVLQSLESYRAEKGGFSGVPQPRKAGDAYIVDLTPLAEQLK